MLVLRIDRQRPGVRELLNGGLSAEHSLLVLARDLPSDHAPLELVSCAAARAPGAPSLGGRLRTRCFDSFSRKPLPRSPSSSFDAMSGIAHASRAFMTEVRRSLVPPGSAAFAWEGSSLVYGGPLFLGSRRGSSVALCGGALALCVFLDSDGHLRHAIDDDGVAARARSASFSGPCRFLFRIGGRQERRRDTRHATIGVDDVADVLGRLSSTKASPSWTRPRTHFFTVLSVARRFRSSVLSFEDFCRAIVHMRSSSPGLDGVPYSVWSAVGDSGRRILYKACQDLLRGAPPPPDSNGSLTVYIPKKLYPGRPVRPCLQGWPPTVRSPKRPEMWSLRQLRASREWSLCRARPLE